MSDEDQDREEQFREMMERAREHQEAAGQQTSSDVHQGSMALGLFLAVLVVWAIYAGQIDFALWVSGMLVVLALGNKFIYYR
jgi:hypothetical protein